VATVTTDRVEVLSLPGLNSPSTPSLTRFSREREAKKSCFNLTSPRTRCGSSKSDERDQRTNSRSGRVKIASACCHGVGITSENSLCVLAVYSGL
jgi:hypothetical protein